MTPTQIEYFLMAARCLNFTESASKLFISQSALSRQISAIEQKLDMLLFIRGAKSLQLTPAGHVLLKEFPAYMDMYNHIIEKAKVHGKGCSQFLRIGMLEGNRLSEPFTYVFSGFAEKHTEIYVTLDSLSYTDLIKNLYDGTLDVVITVAFDIDERKDLDSITIGQSETFIALRKDLLPKNNPKPKLQDLKDKTFLCVAPTETGQSAIRTIMRCREAGFEPDIRYAPSVVSLMLWVEAGLGVALLHDSNTLRGNAMIEFVEMDGVQSLDLKIVWKKNNNNPATPIFLSQFQNGKS